MEETRPSRANIDNGDERKPRLISKEVDERPVSGQEPYGQLTLRSSQAKNLGKNSSEPLVCFSPGSRMISECGQALASAGTHRGRTVI